MAVKDEAVVPVDNENTDSGFQAGEHVGVVDVDSRPARVVAVVHRVQQVHLDDVCNVSVRADVEMVVVVVHVDMASMEVLSE